MIRLLQLGRWFLLAMLLAWALVFIGVLVVAKCGVRVEEELEQQAGEEKQDSHRRVA
jgi:hypothetical protein